MIRIFTQRLLLSVPELADAAAMHSFAVRNKEHFAPWSPIRPPEYYTLEHWLYEIPQIIDRTESDRGLELVLRHKDDESGPILGHCNFRNFVRGAFQAAHLGYGLDREAVGLGYMEEAVRAAIRYCFEELRLHRIMANYMPANDRSARLLDKLGFEREGYARQYLFLNGAWQDHVLTALINESWQPQDV